MSAAAAIAFIGRGLCPVPVPLRSKRPRLGDDARWRRLASEPGLWLPERPSITKDGDAWDYLRLTPEGVQRHMPAEGNVGINLGEPSHGLADVDQDCAEALEFRDRFLPPTAAFGRKGRPRSHSLYISPGAITEPFEDLPRDGKRGEMLVELRATARMNLGKGIGGSQTIVPPSIHTSGESIDWCDDAPGDPVEIAAAELRERVVSLAEASILMRRCNRAEVLAWLDGGAYPKATPDLLRHIRRWYGLDTRAPARRHQAAPPTDGRTWLEDVRGQGVAVVAQAFGFSVEDRGGRPAGLRPCPACGDKQRGHSTPDRRAPAELTADGLGWHCYRCSAKGDAVDVAALGAAGKPSRELTRADWSTVRNACAARSLCSSWRQA